ncbi:MAG: NAD-dependent epimerase/dehydratase family protein [Myxococcales bacterium FL481]|nr:MAG: NAD-dependent epimerase/dehydratase family protein [Myxococcales bacterium FL481]
MWPRGDTSAGRETTPFSSGPVVTEDAPASRPSRRPTLVVGAGFLGARVAARQAADAAHPVLATTRSGHWSGPSDPPPGVTLQRLNIIEDSDDVIQRTVSEVGAAVICVATGGHQDREQLYIAGARRVVASLNGNECRRVVYVSSTSALADRDGPVDELATAWPTSARGRVQREAEQAVQQAAQAHGIPCLVLRLGGLYGPGRGIGRIYRQRRPDAMPGDGWQATNLIHVEDAATAVLAALAAPSEVEGIVHVCDDDHRPRRALYERAALCRGRPPPRWEQPQPVNQAPRGKIVENNKLKRLLGVQLAFPCHVVELD